MSSPLAGIRVMDLGRFLAAPYTTSILASLGAEVIKVEPLPPGEPYRRGLGVSDEYFVQYNAGKKSISVNLKDPSGLAVVNRLLETCDVLVHNLRPGKPEKIGLGFDQLSGRLPRLVYAAVSGFGNAGELRSRPGYDSAAESLSGLYARLAPEGVYEAGGLPLADTTTGVVTALGVCAALARRNRTGEGGLVETSLFEVSAMLSTEGMSYDMSRTALDAAGPAKAVIPSYSSIAQTYAITLADSSALVVTVGESDRLWDELMAALVQCSPVDLSEFRELSYGERVRRHDLVARRIQAAVAESGVSIDDLLSQLSKRSIPVARVRSYREVVRGTSGEPSSVVQRTAGDVDLVRLGFTVDGAWPDRTQRVPRIGEDTNALLTELGFGDDLERLVENGIVHCAPSDEGGGSAA